MGYPSSWTTEQYGIPLPILGMLRFGLCLWTSSSLNFQAEWWTSQCSQSSQRWEIIHKVCCLNGLCVLNRETRVRDFKNRTAFLPITERKAVVTPWGRLSTKSFVFFTLIVFYLFANLPSFCLKRLSSNGVLIHMHPNNLKNDVLPRIFMMIIYEHYSEFISKAFETF